MPQKKSRPFIALLSDFGLADNFVGVMKGVIARQCPEAAVIDITHSIPPHSILHASLALKGAFRFFPDGTIFLAVVDPGVGTERKIVAVAGSQMIFIAPDNGLLYPLLDGLERPEMWEITWRPESKEISATFHGRDIFAPVAGMLACGTPLRRVAKPVRNIKPFHIPRPRSAGGEVSGEVIYVDNFGNLMTNVSREFLRQERGGQTAGLTLSIGKDKIRGVSDSYAAAEKGEAVLVFNSYDMLEIAVNQGSASEKFKARPGTKIKVSRI